MNRASLKAEIERLIVRRYHPHGADSDQHLFRRRRPVTHRPPAIKLSHSLKIRPRNHNGLAVAGARHYERERRNHPTPGDHRLCLRNCVRGKGSAVPADQNDVRPIVAKLAPQFGLNVHVNIQHRRSDSCRHNHGEQCSRRASSPQHRRAQQHTHKHRSMRSVLPVGGYIWRGMRSSDVHSSPRKANTGSSPTALRIAAALPAKVTITAIISITGKSTGAIVICELKIDLPISRANTAPAAKPTKPPNTASNVASAKKTDATATLPAPKAFISPTSVRRSKIAVAIAADTARADANSAASVTRKIKPSMRVSTAPSFCATCRICSACECGIASCN